MGQLQTNRSVFRCSKKFEIKQSLPGWGDNCGSESSTLETDVCVWRYAPLVVLATQEEEEEKICRIIAEKFTDTFSNQFINK